MASTFSFGEIQETLRMVRMERLDIRTITLGINLLDCIRGTARSTGEAIFAKIVRCASRLGEVALELENQYGIPIVNRRVAVTPVSLLAADGGRQDYLTLARYLNEAAREVNVNFLGGFSALVHKGMTPGEQAMLEAIPESLASFDRVCSSVNVATTRAGINMDAIRKMGLVIMETARLTAHRDGIGCAKLVVFANAPEDNPFMAGAFHGVGEPETVLNVGVSGPGVILQAVREHPEMDLGAVAETIKKLAFKVTRMGELVGRAAAARLGVPFGIVDISLAPTPAAGDSVAEILEAMGLERCGGPGTTAALALLNDAVKKGGAMASSYVGGLSGAFIPVSEDAGMVRAVADGALSLEKLEAMTCVCSVGLDMIALPGDVSAETISAIIADEAAIGVVNHKTTGVRVIPAPGKKAGDWVEFGGLLGSAPVMPVNRFDPSAFVTRGGRIPAPLRSLGN